jgi:pyruvate/2-oxoglutarate dehydrogenase complex dihydrolipoamide acyltransferase (E2) component
MAKAYRVLKQCFLGNSIRKPGSVVVDDEFTGPVPSYLELIEGPEPEPEPVEIAASDAARALADEYGVDLSLVTGTGADGNITKGDVQAFISAQE